MIKESITTHLKNMRYLIVVLGILFVIILACISIFAKGTTDSISGVTSQILEYLNENSLSFAPVGDAIKEGGSFFKALGEVLGNYSGFFGTIVSGVSFGLVGVAGTVIVALILLLVGLFISHDIIFVMARYNKESRNIIEAWFEIFVRNVLVLLNLLLIVYCFYMKSLYYAGVVLLILFPVSYCFLSLLGEWLAAGSERPRFSDVITLKNVALLFLENLISIILSIILSAIIFFLFGGIIGFFVGMALMILGLVSVSLNAQAFLFGDNTWVLYMPKEEVKTEQNENIVE